MPRANRYFMPNYVWHTQHHCHKKEFLLKFACDRRRWRYWLFEAKKRYNLCVLNFIVTSNHMPLLVKDRGDGEIARSMQLIAGRTAQEFNRRKTRKGAFREDRYQATAVDTENYLARCMTYIDLNMVRAGVVRHPGEWTESFAIGGSEFVDEIKIGLGVPGMQRESVETERGHVLKEPPATYEAVFMGEMVCLRGNNRA